MSRNHSEVFVETGSQAIAETRRIAREVKRQRVDEILVNLHGNSLSSHARVNTLVRQRGRAMKKLREVLSEPDRPDRSERQAAAVVFLWHLGADDGRDLLWDRLLTGSASDKIAILRALISNAHSCNYHVDGERHEAEAWIQSRRFRGSDVADIVLDLLGDPDPEVVRAAANLAESVRFPGVAERALTLAANASALKREELLILAATGDRELSKVVSMAGSQLREATHHYERYRLVCALSSLKRRGDPEIARQAITELSQFVERVGATHSDTGFARQVLEGIPSSTRPPVAEQDLLAALDAPDPIRRAEAIWALEKWTLPELLRRCHQAGLITRVPTSRDIDAEYTRSFGRGSRESASDQLLFHPFMVLLERAGVVVRFRQDVRWNPLRYDYLIRTFIRLAEPWLRLQWLSEVAVAGPDQWSYTIRFVANARVYRLEMPYHSKYYLHAPEVVALLNRVLEDSGAQERFFDLNNEGQLWIFGPPDVLRHLSREIFLGLAAEPEIANDAVREYVRRRKL